MKQCKAQKANDIWGQIVTKLVNYTKSHFTAEEGYMQRAGYLRLLNTKKSMRILPTKFWLLRRTLTQEKHTMSVSITSYLRTWLCVTS